MAHKSSGDHDGRYYTKEELNHKVNANCQRKEQNYANHYVSAETWSYIGPDGIILTYGKWLVTYSVHVSANAANSGKIFSARSTIDNARGCSFVIDTKYSSRASFSEIIITEGINNLKLQIYSPMAATYSGIYVILQAIRLND